MCPQHARPGTALDDGDPVDGATVDVLADGSYELSVRPGDYTLVADAEGFERVETALSLDPDGVTTIDVTVDPDDDPNDDADDPGDEPDDPDDTDADDGFGPGFGVGTIVTGIGGVAYALRRRLGEQDGEQATAGRRRRPAAPQSRGGPRSRSPRGCR